MTYTLHRPGWTNYVWVPHGTPQPIRFNEADTAVVDADLYDQWVGDERARVMGITVTTADCPTCGATGDEPCRKPSGQTAKRHKSRNH